MLIRILKEVVLSNVGTFKPGMVANIPRSEAEDWIKNGEAMFYDGKPLGPGGQEEQPAGKPSEKREAPKEIAKGLFWCGKHHTLHRATSKQGIKCLKRIEAEKAKAGPKE